MQKQSLQVNFNNITNNELSYKSDSTTESMQDFIVSDDNDLEAIFASKLGVDLNQLKHLDDSPDNQIRYYDSAYGSCPLYRPDEGKVIVAIHHPMIYRFRGE